MTFFICLFIVLMQFLWRYINDLVGKGLDISVIAELFCYAAISMVPMALPLSILLASLMAFGNLGEHFELTAMKSSGVSLLKVMSPLIVFLSFVSVGAFFFQNDVLPKSQVKMWSLLFSMRQKSPELDIPEEMNNRNTIELKLEEEISGLKITNATLTNTNLVINFESEDYMNLVTEGKDMPNGEFTKKSVEMLNITDEEGNVYQELGGGTTENNGFKMTYDVTLKDLSKK